MGKPGPQRKSKRKARKKVEKQLPSYWQPSTEEEAKQNNRLVRMARRWNTVDAEADFDPKKIDYRKMSALSIAMLTTRRNMMSADPVVSNSAVRNLIAMEGQNQKDEMEVLKEPAQHLHVHTDNPYSTASDDAILQAKLALENLKKSAEQ